jgi:outer membrane protein OmpA-like peptidoglycan-associated protein
LEEDLPAVTALTEKPLPEAPFEVAALPSKAEPIKKEPAKEGNIPNTQIIFGETDTEIPPAMESNLGGIAKQLVDNPRSTVSVIAYASGGKGQASNARRISLSRALAVRAYLIDQGANSLQINVQAMGNKTKGQIERADIFLKNVN